MKVISRHEAISQLGRFEFFNSFDRKLKRSATYLSGVTSIDESKGGFGMGHYVVNFEQRPNGLEVEIDQPWDKNRIVLLLDEIEFIAIEPCEQIIEKKDKSIIGRAILGGLIFGAVGAIVGAMTGIKPKEVVISGVHNILLIKHREYTNALILSVDNKNYHNADQYFQQCFPRSYKYPHDLVRGLRESDKIDEMTI